MKRDWLKLTGSLETFHKQFLKSAQLSTRSGSGSKLFVKTVVMLSAELSSFSQEPDFKKHMSSLQAKAFNSLNQRVKKYMREIEPSDIASAELSLQRGADSETDSSGEMVEADGANDTATLSSNITAVADIMSMPKEDVTFEMIDLKLKEIATSRGKKGVDRARVVQQLRYIATLSKCPVQEVEILLHIVSAQFDLSGSMSTYMSTPVWRSCLSNILSIMQLLQSHTHISLIDEAELDTRPTNDEILAGAAVQLRGSLRAFAERIDDEYTKSLQCLDAHTKEYVSRLQDEGALLILLHQVSKFYENTNTHTVTSLSLRLLERIHCKSCSTFQALQRYTDFRIQSASSSDHRLTAANVDSEVLETDVYATTFRLPSLELSALVEALSTYIYKHGDERAKARTLLCQIFNEALHGNLRTAKELLLMSHLQENIQLMDISTQILFNRAVAQLGICAFELGQFDEAFTFLSDLFAGGRTKELLAQGLTQSRFNDRSAEQEKFDRRRQFPHHLHINLDLLESIFLVCTMLLEVSDLLSSKKAASRARHFSRIIDYYNRQLFMGPPDNARDTILTATKMILVGDYEEASQLLLGLPVWGALAESRRHVLEVLDERVKVEAIRVFLQQFAEQYTSASVELLAHTVSLTNTKVSSIISSMIANEDVPAVYDELAHILQLSHSKHTQLESAISTFAEKVLILLDANERALDRHVGTENTVHDDEEPTRTRRQEKSSTEPDESHSRRSRSEQGRGKFSAFDFIDSTTKLKNRDSYGHFSRRKTSREILPSS